MISELDHDEKKTLLGILKFIINADGRISEGEIDRFSKLAEDKGFADFNSILNEVNKEVENLNDLSKLLNNVTAEGHREEIVQLALEMAQADGIAVDSEGDLINYVSRVWNIEIKPG